jgi:thiol-disulfide isomerase/thioredoxin
VPQGDAAVAGWQVPDFDFETLEGEARNISDYRGQIVFLNFWATWCEPCVREMPVFEEFMAEERDDAVILAVNNGEDPAAVRDFQQLFRLETLPLVMDPDYRISDGFGVMNLPVTYVLDGEGVVQGFKLGEITREDIDAYIADIQGDT